VDLGPGGLGCPCGEREKKGKGNHNMVCGAVKKDKVGPYPTNKEGERKKKEKGGGWSSQCASSQVGVLIAGEPVPCYHRGRECLQPTLKWRIKKKEVSMDFPIGKRHREGGRKKGGGKEWKRNAVT